MFLIKDTYYLRNLKLSKGKEKYISFSVKKRIQIDAFVSGRSRSDKPRKSAVMYLCARGIGHQMCLFLCFLYWILEMFQQCVFFTLMHILTLNTNQSINQSINLRFACCMFSHMYADSACGSWSMLCSIIDIIKCKLVLTYFIVQI